MKFIQKLVVVVGVALVSFAAQAGVFSNSVLATNNMASTAINTNTTGNTLPIIPFRDAVIMGGVVVTGTNAATATGALGFDLYDSTTAQWTTGQPLSATLSVYSNGTANVAYTRTFVAATNLYGMSYIRWDTGSATGATNCAFTNVDFIQIP